MAVTTSLTIYTDRFPAGTTVGLYSALEEVRARNGQVPSTSPVATDVMGDDERLDFAGLAYATNYFAYAVVSGQNRWVQTDTGDPPSTEERLSALEDRVVDEKLWLHHVAEDNNLPFDRIGTNDPTTRAENKAVVDVALAQVKSAPPATVKTIGAPAGVIALDPLRGISGPVVIEGASPVRSVTTLLFRNCLDDTALGGDCALDLRDSATGLVNLRVSGAATLPEMGIDPPEEYGTGVRLGHGYITNVEIGGFCYPLDGRQDHIPITNVHVLSGWCAMLFGASHGHAGDAMIDRLFGSGDAWCGLAIHPSYYIGGVVIQQSHFFHVPYGVWKMAASRRHASYSTGTMSVAAGGTVVTGQGTAWKANVKDGSHLVVSGVAADTAISHVVDDTTIILASPWPSTTRSMAAYQIDDGTAPIGSMLFNAQFIDTAFEAVNTHVASEDGNGEIIDTHFHGCGSGSLSQTVTRPEAEAAGAYDYHFGGLARMQNVTFDDDSSMTDGLTRVAAVQSTQLTNVDFGDVGSAIDQYRAASLPWIRPVSGNLALQNVKGNYVGTPVRFGVSRLAPVYPYDLVEDGGRTAANSLPATGNDIRPHGTAKGDWLGAAMGLGVDSNDGVPYVFGREGAMRVAIAPSCIVADDTAFGATTIVVLDTSRLGTIGTTGLSLRNTAGAVVASGASIASATQLTVPAFTGVNEKQTVTVTGSTFQLATTSREYTDLLPSTASPADVLAALETLTHVIADGAVGLIGTGNIAVTGPAGGPYVIEFINDLGGRDIRQLTAVRAIVSTSQPGAGALKGVQLWVDRAAEGATIAESTRAKARYGSAGSAASDKGQVIAVGTDATDAPLVGSTTISQPDTGRTVILIPEHGVLSTGLSKTLLDAKGDVIAATANDTPARLAVGTDGQELVADSSASTGLVWRDRAASGTHAARVAITNPAPGRPWKETDTGLLYVGNAAANGWDVLRPDGQVVKTADETVNNSAAVQDDDHLLFPIEANSQFFVEAFLLFQGVSANADWVFGFSGPASATAAWSPFGRGSDITGAGFLAQGTATAISTARDITQTAFAAGISGKSWQLIAGLFTAAGTAGTIKFRWAQGTATAEDSKVLAGSFLRIRRLV